MVRAIDDGNARVSSLFPQARRFGGPDVRISSCCSQATHVQPGDIYIALVGADGDGHDEIDEAVRRGASAAIVERPLPVSLTQYVVEDSRDAFGLLCQHVVGNPADSLGMIGVTGTHGKTTVTLLIQSILRAAGCEVGCSNTLGWNTVGPWQRGEIGTPTAPEMARRLSEIAAQGCNAAIVEVNSRSLAERHVAGISWDVGVINNVRRAHLHWHGSVLNYRRAKLRLLNQLKPGGTAVINVDDPATRFFHEELSGNVRTFGLNESADVTATLIERFAGEQTFLLTAGRYTAAVRTRMIGDHHVYNCLAAATATLSIGVDLATVVRGLESVESVPGRLERIECGQPFGVFVDGAHCPDRLAVVLKALREVTQGRLICVFGPDGSAPREYRPLLGRVVERHANLGIITSNNPSHEKVLSISHDVIDGYAKASRAHVMPDRIRAVQYALQQARAGDTVLLAGKGDAVGQKIGDQLVPIDDRQVARDWLYEVGARQLEAQSHPMILRLR